MREAIALSHRLSITIRCLAERNTFEDLKFINAVSPQPTSITVLGTCLMFGRRTVTERMLRSTNNCC
jgi:hypothetical protein